MNTPAHAAWSSAEVIQSHAKAKKTFAKDSKAWLAAVLAHPELTSAAKVLLAAIYWHFNTKHYHETGGELFAWPARDTLIAETALSIETFNQAINQAKHYGILHVQHGRRLGHGHREVNKYFARMPWWPQGQKSGPLNDFRGQKFRGSRGQDFRGSRGQKNRQDSVIGGIGEYIIGDRRGLRGQNFFSSEELDPANRTPERALRPEEKKVSASNSDSEKIRTPKEAAAARRPRVDVATPELRKIMRNAADGLQRMPAATPGSDFDDAAARRAGNGGGWCR
jgi:hypothetical protein